jgi:hypothetical protein
MTRPGSCRRLGSYVTGKSGGNIGDATIILYLVVTLTVQRFILLNRVARQEAAGQIPFGEPQVPLGN